MARVLKTRHFAARHRLDVNGVPSTAEMIQLVEGDVAPTLSEWGVIVMALLVLTAGTLIWVWRRPGFADARTSRR